MRAVNTAGTSGNSSQACATPTAPSPQLVKAVNSGGVASSPFVADANFSGGSTASSTATIVTTGVTNPAPLAVYKDVRWGAFTYTLPALTAGASYKVRLHFAELTWNAANQRKFNVLINGSNVLSAFDVYVAAGNAKNKAVVREFTATANASGQLVIQFTAGGADNPMVNGIEIRTP